MRMRLNRKAMLYIVAGLLVSFVCLYFLLWSFTLFDGGAFFYGCMLFPICIFLFSRAPDDGLIGKWLLPAYALALNFLIWAAMNTAWNRLSPNKGEGLDAGFVILIFQVIATFLSFLPKVQRVIRYRMGIAMVLFYPLAVLYLSVFK